MRYFLFTIAMLASLAASAVTVSSTPGALASLVTDKSITELIVTGKIDARDIAFIADELNDLTVLNLSSAQIEAFSGTVPSLGDAESYPAGEIPARAFAGKGYSRVTLPSSIISIGDAAFAGCRSLATVNLPAKLQSIGNDAFNNSGVTAATIPVSVTNMGKRAFANCRRLTHAYVNCAELGIEAFAGCHNLMKLSIAKALRSIGDGAFKGTGRVQITIPEGSLLATIGDNAFRNSQLDEFNFEALTNLKSIGAWAFANTSLTSVSIPHGVIAVGDGAFFYNTELTSVALPRSLSVVSNFVLAGDNAVVGDSILMKGHNSVGDYAFYNWDQTEKFVVSSSVNNIGERAFAGMTALNSLYAYPRQVPQLGANVWEGVDQAHATLRVHGSVVDNYSVADQWMDFGGIFAYKNVTLDLNNDGGVDVADVVALANFTMGDVPQVFDIESADVNGDGNVDISDVVFLSNIIMGS